MKYNPVNILIVGQTGAGKSSLLNYMLQNEQSAKASTGFPVTTKGFHLYKGINGEFPIHLSDSWGIEIGKFDEWLKSLKSFVQKQTQIDSVWFCINSHSHRIQRAELDVMNYLISKDINVTVVFTKATPSQAHKTDMLQQAIVAEIPIIQTYIRVNSVDELLMSGEKLDVYGADVLKEQLADLIVDKNALNLKARLTEHLKKQIDEDFLQKEEIHSYVADLLALPAHQMFKVLQKEDVNWLLKAKHKWSEKTSPLLKKANSMKQIVKRTKQENEQNEVNTAVIQIVDELASNGTIKTAIKQVFMEGQMVLHES